MCRAPTPAARSGAAQAHACMQGYLHAGVGGRGSPHIYNIKTRNNNVVIASMSHVKGIQDELYKLESALIPQFSLKIVSMSKMLQLFHPRVVKRL